MKRKLLFSAIIGMGLFAGSCTDYLEVEGKLGNVQNLETIFENKNYTEQWLAKAFTYLTMHNVDIQAKDYCITNFSDDMCYGDRSLEYRKFKYAEYNENWKQEGWTEAYDGIRQASIFIHNVDRNKELTPAEITDFKAQARFVRAYLYWKLLQKYGPVPLIPDEGLDYQEDYANLSIPRSTYDECADFIAREMIMAAHDLPEERDTRNVARPTRGAALATRAKALLYAASPINNPRPSDTERFTDLVDDEGRNLIAQEYSEEKWARAAAAVRDVVEMGKKGIYDLYVAPARKQGTVDYPATIVPPYDERYFDKKYPDGWVDIDPLQSYAKLFDGSVYPSDNREMIFTLGTNVNMANDMVKHQMPHEAGGYNCHGITGKQCDAYEMNTGEPFDKNKMWKGDENYITAQEAATGEWKPLHEGVNKRYGKREPRFYASVAYNGAFWPLASASLTENRNKQVFYYRGQDNGWINGEQWIPTGIGIMKYVNTRDFFGKDGATGTVMKKPVIGIRYADVLLWYAETLNELTPGKVYNYLAWDGAQEYTISREVAEMSYAISRIRIRAGLPDYDPSVYNSQDEFRMKLKHERQIEMFAENSRYFDLRRWKDAEKEESQPVYGCNPKMTRNERDYFHQQIVISDLPTTFNRKMYFWPIKHEELRRNIRLTQNPGWTTFD